MYQAKNKSSVVCHATHFQPVEQPTENLMKKAQLHEQSLKNKISEITTSYRHSPRKNQDLITAIMTAVFEGANINKAQYDFITRLNEDTTRENTALNEIIVDISNNADLKFKDKINHGIVVGMNLAEEIQAKIEQANKRLSR